VRDLGASTGCSAETPEPPPLEMKTTPPVPIVPSEPQNASEAVRFQVCKGKSQKIEAPPYKLVYIESANYRVQLTLNDVCLPQAITDCVGLYFLDCNLRQSCTFNLLAEASVFDCQNKKADSITGVYRYIPSNGHLTS
jgi:hypothetical protein